MPSELKLPRLQLQTSRPASVDFFRIIPPCVAFASGFFFQFDIMTATFGLPFLRITDALMFLFVPLLLMVVGINRSLRDGLVYFVVALAVVAASLMFKTAVDEGDKYLTLVFLLTSVFAFFFVEVADEKVFVWYSIGTLLGLIPSLGVLFIQAGGNTGLVAIGLGVPVDETRTNAALFASIKFGGMWVHGNEAGHVYALAIASALYLAFKFRQPLIYIGYYVLLVASFSVTLNRGGLIAPTIALAYCFLRLGSFFLYVQTAVIAAVGLIVLTQLPNAPGLDTLQTTFEARFVNDSYADSNITERLMSNVAGIQVALENPFGIGIKERFTVMAERTLGGVVSIHNGFLSLSYQSSIFVSLFFIVSCIYLLLNWRTVPQFYTIMYLFTATSMMFEELSINQYFIFAVALTIAAAWLQHIRNRSMAAKPAPLLKPHPLLSRRSR